MTAARRLAASSPPPSACACIGMVRPKTAPTAASHQEVPAALGRASYDAELDGRVDGKVGARATTSTRQPDLGVLTVYGAAGNRLLKAEGFWGRISRSNGRMAVRPPPIESWPPGRPLPPAEQRGSENPPFRTKRRQADRRSPPHDHAAPTSAGDRRRNTAPPRSTMCDKTRPIAKIRSLVGLIELNIESMRHRGVVGREQVEAARFSQHVPPSISSQA